MIRRIAGRRHRLTGAAAIVHVQELPPKLNGLNPRDWLIDTLQRLPTLPENRLHELLPLRESIAPS